MKPSHGLEPWTPPCHWLRAATAGSPRPALWLVSGVTKAGRLAVICRYLHPLSSISRHWPAIPCGQARLAARNRLEPLAAHRSPGLCEALSPPALHGQQLARDARSNRFEPTWLHFAPSAGESVRRGATRLPDPPSAAGGASLSGSVRSTIPSGATPPAATRGHERYPVRSRYAPSVIGVTTTSLQSGAFLSLFGTGGYVYRTNPRLAAWKFAS
jgi:hypothetical protein